MPSQDAYRTHLIGPLAQAHQEVVWLDVSMDEALGMDVLDAGQLQARDNHMSVWSRFAGER